MEPLPFGGSHWDYLPDLVQDHILDLSARSLHRDSMKHVCLSIQRHARWQESGQYKKFFSQRCEKCYRIFLSELSMPRHRAICEGFNFKRDYLGLILTDMSDANRSVDDRLYGFSIDEIYAIDDDEDEEEDEDEDDYEPYLFTPFNM